MLSSIAAKEVLFHSPPTFCKFINPENPDSDNNYYDKNGNQTADLNKKIAWIRYNSLNLP
jgi:hypothetical protein